MSDGTVPGPAGSSTGANEVRGLRVRCPQCREAVQLQDDRPLAELSCPSCGSSFNILGDDTLAHQTQGDTVQRHAVGGRFELLEQVGVGTFGVVWKARDTRLDRLVALKTPRHGALTDDDQERFLREGRAAAQLRHPRIVGVHEVGCDGDTVYIVSDWVDGVSLDEYLTAQRLAPRDSAELCAKIAEAMHYAHEQGVVHRDLKPGNILIDQAGEPHVTDFGLAKRESGEVTLTQDGQILGTPAYMSPEQASGEGHHVDRLADVYSLGVVLFRLLTNTLPFQGDVRAVLEQVLEDQPPRPRKLDRAIPRDLETICLKCLEKDPSQRYATSAELADDLRRYLHGHRIRARRMTSTQRGWRLCRRHRMVAGFGVALGVTLTLCVALPGYLSRQMNGHDSVRSRPDAIRSLVPPTPPGPAVRPWTDTSGKLIVSASLVEILDKTVKLRGQDGSVISVPRSQLSESDQAYIARQPGSSVGTTDVKVSRQPLPRTETDVLAPRQPLPWFKNSLNEVSLTDPVDDYVVFDKSGRHAEPPITADLSGFSMTPKEDGWHVVFTTVNPIAGDSNIIVCLYVYADLDGKPENNYQGDFLRSNSDNAFIISRINGEWKSMWCSYGPGLKKWQPEPRVLTFDVRDNKFSVMIPYDLMPRVGGVGIRAQTMVSDHGKIIVDTIPGDGLPPLLTPVATNRRHQEDWAKQLGVPVEVTNSVGMELVLIPFGEFAMGSQESPEELAKAYGPYGARPAEFEGERPAHEVSITKPFYLGKYEVTVGEFRQFVDATGYRTDAEWKGTGEGYDEVLRDCKHGIAYSWRNPGWEQTDRHPVVNVSWNEAVAFCDWLGIKEGHVYRLPTEAEWEYACRAGATTRHYAGDDPELLAEIANVADPTLRANLRNDQRTLRTRDGYAFTAPVGSFRPNAFGLYDMLGNVYEWCADWHLENFYRSSRQTDPLGPSLATCRVVRGGGWRGSPNCPRSSKRGYAPPGTTNADAGFRVVRMMD